MEILAQMSAVFFVLALLAGGLWVLKRKSLVFPRQSGPKQMEVVERVGLGPQHSLALVRVNGRMVLVGTGPGVCEIHNVEVSS